MRKKKVVTRDAQHVVSEIEGLRAELEAVQARRIEYEALLEDLARQQNEAAAQLELSQKEAAESSARLLEREAELEKVRQQEAAYDAFREALSRRDAAGLEAAAAIDAVVAGLLEYAQRHEMVLETREAVTPGYDVTMMREPQELVDAWQRLIELVRSRIDEKLEDEVVDAAARSSFAQEIEKLPKHLQAVARIRRRQYLTQRG